MNHCRLIQILVRSPLRVAAFSTSSSTTSASSSASRLLKIGDVLRDSRRFSEEDVYRYADVTGDRNPIHLDAEFARRAAAEGFSGDRVVHGMLVASLFPSIIASHFPGAVYVSQTLQFKLPVYIGDAIVAEVQAINMKGNKNRYIVKFSTKCFKDTGNIVVDGEAIAILPALEHTVNTN